MALIADILLIAGAIGAAFYCLVLSRRLARLTNLENGVGGAIAGLSQQVSEMNAAFERANDQASASSDALSDSTKRAEAAARRLEMLLASLHDLPSTDAATAATQVVPRAEFPEPAETKPSGPTFRRRLGPASRREAAE